MTLDKVSNSIIIRFPSHRYVVQIPLPLRRYRLTGSGQCINSHLLFSNYQNMKNFILIILTIIGLLIVNGSYFEYVVSREVSLWVTGVTTLLLTILDGLGLWVLVRQIQKLLNL